MSYLEYGKFELIAHRGGSPENTIAAFKKTLEIYPHFVFELDVHKSRDGEIVVIHDETIDRTTNGHGAVKDLSYSEIASFDQNGQVPRLKDIFETFPHSKISIDLKEPGYEKEVIGVIQKAGAENRVVLASFHGEALKTARHLAPHICFGYGQLETTQMVLAAKLRMPLIAPTLGHVFQIPLSTKNIAVYSKKFLELAHDLSNHVHVWTINEEKEMEKLIKDGVDGIVTDNPQLLFNVAKRLNKIEEKK